MAVSITVSQVPRSKSYYPRELVAAGIDDLEYAYGLVTWSAAIRAGQRETRSLDDLMAELDIILEQLDALPDQAARSACTTWAIRTDRDFDRASKKLDRRLDARVLKTLVARENLDDPTTRSKALSGPYTGLSRLRVGDFGVILDIRRGEFVIAALDVGNRSGIYD